MTAPTHKDLLNLARAATEDILGVKVLNQEKFAELIVRECSFVIQDFVDHRFPASEYPRRLREYFGVKQ